MRLKPFSCFARGVHRAGFGSRVLRHRRQLDQTLHGRRQKPTGKTKTETIVGENGKVYWTREEAITAMGKEKICVDSH